MRRLRACANGRGGSAPSAGAEPLGAGRSIRPAAFAGASPVPRDSGKVSGNLQRPTRYGRRRQRAFYTSALISIRCCDESRRFYGRNRAEGKRHSQAVMTLARRRVNVPWIERTYHRRRRQASLGRLTPVEYETVMTTPALQAA